MVQVLAEMFWRADNVAMTASKSQAKSDLFANH